MSNMSNTIPFRDLSSSAATMAASDHKLTVPATGVIVLRPCGSGDYQGDALKIKDRFTTKLQVKPGKKDGTVVFTIKVKPEVKIARTHGGSVPEIDKGRINIVMKQSGQGVLIGNAKVVLESFTDSKVKLKVELNNNTNAWIEKSKSLQLDTQTNTSFTKTPTPFRETDLAFRLVNPDDLLDSLTLGERKSIEEATENGGYLNYDAA